MLIILDFFPQLAKCALVWQNSFLARFFLDIKILAKFCQKYLIRYYTFYYIYYLLHTVITQP